MFDEIISLENLFTAWKAFCSGKRNREDVRQYERRLEDNIFALHNELSIGAYKHGSYQRFHIFDPKHRVIHKATVKDRIVHHAVYQVLLTVFERSFIFDSYSCRDEKGTHAAVRRLEQFAGQASKNYYENCWALKFDIKRFFDSVDHEILLGILGQKVQDERVMGLLEKIICSFQLPVMNCSVGGGVH